MWLNHKRVACSLCWPPCTSKSRSQLLGALHCVDCVAVSSTDVCTLGCSKPTGGVFAAAWQAVFQCLQFWYLWQLLIHQHVKQRTLLTSTLQAGAAPEHSTATQARQPSCSWWLAWLWAAVGPLLQRCCLLLQRRTDCSCVCDVFPAHTTCTS